MRNHSRISSLPLVYVYRGKRHGKRHMRSRTREKQLSQCLRSKLDAQCSAAQRLRGPGGALSCCSKSDFAFSGLFESEERCTPLRLDLHAHAHFDC